MTIDTPKATVNAADIGYVKEVTAESALVTIDSAYHNAIVVFDSSINGDITLSSSAENGTKVVLFNPTNTEIPFLSTTFANNNPTQLNGRTAMTVLKTSIGWCVVSIV